ncbi:MAG: hypothetical protein OEL75_02230, partial [Kiritimatiellaceae bacterium]|nr:hypothetical protein [Kiritimatiellaceae bacterium]
YHERSIERILESLRSDVAAQSTSAHQFHTIALSKVDTAVGAVSGVNSSLSGIRGFLDENSRMIKRFEEGYDYQILKNFVRQIARSIKNLEKQISKVGEGDSREELIDARDDLVEMFERNGISPIRPSVGDVYVGMEQFVEVSNDKIQTSDPSLKGKIAEVESAGYLYDFNDGQQRLIQAARVKLYE